MDENSTYSEESEFLLFCFKEMREVFYRLERSPLASYDLVQSPDQVDAIYMMFYEMMSENIQALANEINALSRWTDELIAWGVVLADKTEYQKFYLYYAIIDALGVAAIGLPYALKQRFSFCSSHTTHQANRFVDKHWNEAQLPSDRGINVNTPDRISGNWKRWPALKSAIAAINDKKYIEATGDYRARLNHRLPLRLGFGQTGFITRSAEQGGDGVNVIYAVGGRNPLKIDQVTDSLQRQVDCSLAALDAYAELLREQIGDMHQI